MLIVLLPMKLQGAPQDVITSEELGKAMEQFQEGVRSQYRPKQLNSYAQWGAATAYYPFEAFAQVRGVTIRNCGPPGNIIQSALAILDRFRDKFGVLVDCQEKPNCARVRVDVPADDRKADVRVCDLGKSNNISTIIVHCDSIHFSAEQLMIQVMIYYLIYR